MTRGLRFASGFGVLVLAAAVGALHDQEQIWQTLEASERDPIGDTPRTRKPSSATADKALSGVSDGKTAKTFAKWRGTPLGIAGTWADVDAADAPKWALGRDSDWAWWDGPVDIALGGPRGKSWAQAAKGELDKEWRAKLKSLKAAWAPRDPARLYVRFAHEFNGNFMPWSVKDGDVANYKLAFARFTALQRQILPGSRAVWPPNAGTNHKYDVRTTYPGDKWVDVIGVDWYNSWPWVNTAKDFQAKIHMRQDNGGPIGIERWREFAAKVGKPLALPEWGNDSVGAGKSNESAEGGGDAPVFFREFHAWLDKHGGAGSGQVLYEVYFNIVKGYPASEFWLTNGAGATNPRMPKSTAVYRNLW